MCPDDQRLASLVQLFVSLFPPCWASCRAQRSRIAEDMVVYLLKCSAPLGAVR